MPVNKDSMAKEDRAEEILDYLADNEVALPPQILHRQLKLFRNAKWSLDTTRRRLDDFEEEGFVERVGVETERPHYRITPAGREALRTGDFERIFD